MKLERDNKIVFEKEKEISFAVLRKFRFFGDYIIRTLNIDKDNFYSNNYMNPPIPEGYKYLCGEWNNGLVMERYSDGSQFVWVPVGSLDFNGVIDAFSIVEKIIVTSDRNLELTGPFEKYPFTEKFGRRAYHCSNGSFLADYREEVDDVFKLQLESVRKYGGFYFSRYYASKNEVTGKPQSVKGAKPWVNISFHDAKKVAASFEDSETVKSHLTFGAEYDSVLEWFMTSKARSRSEVLDDSINWVNHQNVGWPIGMYKYREGIDGPEGIVETGNPEEPCTNKIYGFAGNANVWTQEHHKEYRITRGTRSRYHAYYVPACSRSIELPDYFSDDLGFYIVLCIA